MLTCSLYYKQKFWTNLTIVIYDLFIYIVSTKSGDGAHTEAIKP